MTESLTPAERVIAEKVYPAVPDSDWDALWAHLGLVGDGNDCS